MFTDLSNPSVIHCELTRHGNRYAIAIKRGSDTLYRHKNLLPLRAAWEIGETKLAEFKREFAI